MLYTNTFFRYLSISHHTAPVSRRERFHMSDAGKQELSDAIIREFSDIRSLLILVTCNRTEVYFESGHTRATEIRDFFLREKVGTVRREDQVDFRTSERTEDTVRHLLSVAAGLESSVLGDAEIIHQIKKSYHFSLENHLQGSLLERCMQSLFRSHKRISNETGFRDGTTSTAYKALKEIGDTFGQEAASKKILFVGAGDIVRQLFKYNGKFGYRNVHITNRTASKAEKLAKIHKVSTWDWEKLHANDLAEFDVIIGAAGHCPALISGGVATDRQVLLIDLAVPGNFAASLGNQPHVVLQNLDSIAAQLERNRESRAAAANSVREIVEQEWAEYLDWYQKRPFRALMANRKDRVMEYLSETPGTPAGEDLYVLADRIMRKVLKEPDALHDPEKLIEIASRYTPLQAV